MWLTFVREVRSTPKVPKTPKMMLSVVDGSLCEDGREDKLPVVASVDRMPEDDGHGMYAEDNG